jgi:hypothetical protein
MPPYLFCEKRRPTIYVRIPDLCQGMFPFCRFPVIVLLQAGSRLFSSCRWLRWERLDRAWNTIRRSRMVSFRVQVDRDNVYAILLTSIVLCFIFWLSCSLFFAPALDDVS